MYYTSPKFVNDVLEASRGIAGIEITEVDELTGLQKRELALDFLTLTQVQLNAA